MCLLSTKHFVRCGERETFHTLCSLYPQGEHTYGMETRHTQEKTNPQKFKWSAALQWKHGLRKCLGQDKQLVYNYSNELPDSFPRDMGQSM